MEPTRIGPYEIRETLGQGGMGVVYRAWDPRLERELAVKVLAPTANPERFRREAEAMAKVSHPHVVRVHASGVDPRGCPWLAMELVSGRALSERIEEERTLPVAEATRLARELGEALSEVHQAGLFHRDVKPANVLLRDGQALLTDFGLAREDDEAERLTRTGQILGTPGYAAPELLAGPGEAQGGAPADVYGLGATLYAMLTGAPPVSGATLQEILVATASTPPPPPHLLNPSVPLWLSQLCLRCLEKDPERRPTLPELLPELIESHGAARGPRPWVWLGAAALAAAAALAGALRAESGAQPSPSPDLAESAAPSASASRREASDDDLVRALLAIERRLLESDSEGAGRVQARFEDAAPRSMGARLLRERLRFQRSSRKKRRSFVTSIAPLASADSTGLGHYLVGRSYFARRYYRRSTAAFGRAIALRPEPLYRLYRIRAAVFSKDYELIEADIRALDVGVEPWLAPECEGAVARYFLRVGRYTAGRVRVRKLIADYGSTSARLGLLGRLLGAEGVSLVEARRVLDLSLAGRPTDLTLWGARIRLPLIAHDAVEARAVHDRALKALGQQRFSRDQVLVLARLWVELLEGGPRGALGKRARACPAKGPRASMFKARLLVELGNLGLAKNLLARVTETEIPRFAREAREVLARIEREGR